MACSKCKKKSMVIKESKKEFTSRDSWWSLIIVVWFMLGTYGLYNVITNIINLFK